jgi:hypothetical protein
MKQQIQPMQTELSPQRFPQLYNQQWKTEVIDDVFDSSIVGKQLQNGDMKSQIRSAISELYKGIIMTKVQEISNPKLSIYKAVVEPLTSSPEVRYLVAFVPNINNEQLGSQIRLSELNWINFQTRSTLHPEKEFNGHSLQPQTYSITSNNILHDRIKCVNEGTDKWSYVPHSVDLKIDIIIQKENENFATEGTIISALELFQTIVTLI